MRSRGSRIQVGACPRLPTPVAGAGGCRRVVRPARE